MAASLSIAFTPAGAASAQQLAVYATRPVSPGVNFQPNGAYKLIGVYPGATSPINLLADYVAVYGGLVAGMKILIKMRAIDDTTGYASSPDIQTSVQL